MFAPFGWIRDEGMDYGLFLVFAGFLLIVLGLHFFGVGQTKVFALLFALAPIWLPLTAFPVFFWKYMDMVGKSFYLFSGRRTYEVTLPPEVYKSPEAMETILNQIFNKATPDNLMETYLQGKRPQPFSFEIASRGGDVKFYVNLPVKKGARMLEPAFYSQYPGIELKELPVDYTAEISYDLKDDFLMSFHMQKKKDQVYPIKTYVDCGLTDLPKEEEKVDPMNQMIEFMSAVRPYEQMWVQFICSAHRQRDFKHGQLRNKSDTWEKDVHAKIDELMHRDPITKGPLSSGDQSDFDGMPRITLGERNIIEAMERNVEKAAFDVVIRFVYITKPGKGDGDFFAGMLRAFAAYDIIGRNAIGMRWRTDYNYKFISDPFGKRLDALRRQELKEYKLRKLFPKTTLMNYSVFTSEEIATMWHPLGTVGLTPTLNRVPSAKQQAPSNLPTGPS